jgi:hypothetical protein
MALFCDKFIIDKTEVLTVVRAIDLVTITLPAGSDGRMPPTLWTGALVLSLKSGDLVGEGQLALDLVRPSGKRASLGGGTVVFGGPATGVQVAQDVLLRLTEEGHHWIDVRYEGRLLTRIPLTVHYRPAQTAPEPAPT